MKGIFSIAALVKLFRKVPELMRPAVFVMRQEVSDSFRDLNSRTLIEIRSMVEKVAADQAELT